MIAQETIKRNNSQMEHRLYRIRLRSAAVSPIARTAIAAGSGMPKERPSAIMLEKDPAMAGRAIIAITSALVKTRGIPTLLQNGSPRRTQSYYLVVAARAKCDGQVQKPVLIRGIGVRIGIDERTMKSVDEFNEPSNNLSFTVERLSYNYLVIARFHGDWLLSQRRISMKKFGVLFTVGGVALSASSQAFLLYSFETGTEGFVNPGWSVGDTVLSQSTTGATEGSNALKMARPGTSNGFRWIVADGVSQAVKNDLKLATKVYVDVTLGTDFGASNWFKMALVINQANWNQTGELLISPTGTGLTTLEFDIATIASGIDTSGWMRFGFSLNSDGPSAATVYVDNIRTNAVPEPATLAAIGMGLVALRARRRK